MRPAPPPASAPASAPRPTPTKSAPVSSSPPFGLERRAHGTPGAGDLRTIALQSNCGKIIHVPGLARRFREPERQAVSREGAEVEIRAQHVIRPVQGKGVRQGDADLRAGSGQIGPRDLNLSRYLDRAAKEGLGLQ